MRLIDGDGDGIPLFADPDEGVVAPGIPQGAYVDLGHHGGGQFSQNIIPASPFYSMGGATAQRSPLNYQFLFEQLSLGGTPTFGDPVLAGTAPGSLGVVGFLETVYDTWTPAYESDGTNQDPATSTDFNFATGAQGVLAVSGGSGNQMTPDDIDEGTNGIDDVNPDTGVRENGPDDYNERETQPPYPMRSLA